MKQKLLISIVLLAVIATAAYSYVSSLSENAPVTIGVLHPSPVFTDNLRGFKDRMAELGYREGKDIIYLFDGPSGGGDRLKIAASRLVEAKPDLILVASTPATRQIVNLSKDSNIPIVFAPVNNPVSAGVVKNLRQPGGMATGVRMPASGGKRLQWLKQIDSRVEKVVVPYTKGSRSAKATLKQLATAANQLGIMILELELDNASDIDRWLANAPDGFDAIFMPRDSLLVPKAANINQFALQNKIPTSAAGISQVKSGALFSYAADQERTI